MGGPLLLEGSIVAGGGGAILLLAAFLVIITIFNTNYSAPQYTWFCML